MYPVSIPNGMEFYQRQKFSRNDAKPFQFPTGWNSTELIVRILCKDDRFNSQRDGILRGTRFSLLPCQLFQFPTGWNSTYVCGRLMHEYVFQFPTGWNSTCREAYFALYRKFQFPTGWNSTRLPHARIQDQSVSIPNGMEFYRTRRGYEPARKQFQFPTGWNSTFRHRLFHHLLQFQFPTGWNSTNGK